MVGRLSGRLTRCHLARPPRHRATAPPRHRATVPPCHRATVPKRFIRSLPTHQAVHGEFSSVAGGTTSEAETSPPAFHVKHADQDTDRVRPGSTKPCSAVMYGRGPTVQTALLRLQPVQPPVPGPTFLGCHARRLLERRSARRPAPPRTGPPLPVHDAGGKSEVDGARSELGAIPSDWVTVKSQGSRVPCRCDPFRFKPIAPGLGPCRRRRSRIRALSRAFSAWTGLGRPTGSPGRLPSSRPASRCRRHSEISEEYRPSRRRNTAPCPFSAATSCSARYLCFCSAVHERRRRCPSGRGDVLTTPSSTTATTAGETLLIRLGDPSHALRGELAMNRWTHLTLTRRASPPCPPSARPRTGTRAKLPLHRSLFARPDRPAFERRRQPSLTGVRAEGEVAPALASTRPRCASEVTTRSRPGRGRPCRRKNRFRSSVVQAVVTRTAPDFTVAITVATAVDAGRHQHYCVLE